MLILHDIDKTQIIPLDDNVNNMQVVIIHSATKITLTCKQSVI